MFLLVCTTMASIYLTAMEPAVVRTCHPLRNIILHNQAARLMTCSITRLLFCTILNITSRTVMPYEWIGRASRCLGWPDGFADGAADALAESAARGRKLAALLDSDTPVASVTTGTLRPELATIAVPTTKDGSNMTGDDFAVTAGWGHFGTRGAVMPGHGQDRGTRLHRP